MSMSASRTSDGDDERDQSLEQAILVPVLSHEVPIVRAMVFTAGSS